ncbi:MAG: molybdopterin biosynthesis protein [Caloramator sp.]|nr:molybdopterin biosynthesis protein [Caloramator sp.]
MMSNIYLSNYELDEALNIYFSNLEFKDRLESEEILTYEALGRVTSQAVYSKISYPFYISSAMDGIAVKSERTIGATEKNMIELYENEDYIVVDTGDPIPKGFDSVIMVEDIIKVKEGCVKIYKSALPYENIRPIGEDIVQNTLILPSNHKIRAVDIGALLCGGVNNIKVYKKPKVGIIPTGTEIVEPNENLKVGDIIESNSRVFTAIINEWGGEAVRYNIVKDDYEKIKSAIIKAADENDIVLINAGSSAGREDFTSSIINEIGKVFVHGIAIKPGKPVILGKIKDKPIIGIPGYPVSAYIIMENIVKPLLEKYLGLLHDEGDIKEAILSRRIVSSLKHLEFVRVKLGYVGHKLIATPLNRGAGATMSLVNADGILKIPQNCEGLEAGSKVSINLLKKTNEIKNTIVVIGSHDPILDVVSDLLKKSEGEYSLSSSHVGSMGGILSLKKEECHIAPIHLLDMESGEYNISYINKYLKGMDIALIKGVKRIQGLMVKKGNPYNIKGLKDIAELKLRYINRQKGSGTRLLLDYNLKKLGIDFSTILGYEREEFTHLGVAAAIKEDDADCGMGVYSAALLMDLDFIPICSEEYDFAIPESYLEMPMIKKFIEIIKSNDFIKELERLGGYDYSNCGEIVKVRG